MGIIYYAVNYDKKMYYDLDKGNWYGLVGGIDCGVAFGCKRKLKRLCRKAFRYSTRSWYLDKIAKKLSKIVPFVIIDDLSDTDYNMKYIYNFKCIGSRN